jgi:predicted MFS family arabinose efflux permease
VASAAFIGLGVRARPVPPPDGEQRRSWLRDIGAGARLVWRDLRLRSLVALACVSGFYITVEGLAVPYAAAIGAGPVAVGLLMAANPAGALVGMALANRIPPQRRTRLIGPLAVAACLPLIGCALKPGLVVTLVLWALSGLASAYQMVANAEFVRTVPDARRAQGFGLAVTALIAAQGVGVLAAGFAADRAEPATVVAVAGLLGMVAAIPAALSWARARASSASQAA